MWLTDMEGNPRWAQHLLLFKLAVVFLTRIPVQIKQTVDDEMMNRITGYFALVGALIASLMALVLWGFSFVLPLELSVLLTMAFSLMLTGAFHEDGLADTADGFGGGWLQQQKLSIMKDSRVGTYGATALVISLLIRFQALLLIAQQSMQLVVFSLVVAHMLSRILAVSLIPSMPYVQSEGETKTKPVAKSLEDDSVVLLFLSAGVSFLFITLGLSLSLFDAVLIFLVLALVRFAFIRFTKQQIQGYTGDVLGAAQQVFEIVCYLLVIGLLGGLT